MIFFSEVHKWDSRWVFLCDGTKLSLCVGVTTLFAVMPSQLQRFEFHQFKWLREWIKTGFVDFRFEDFRSIAYGDHREVISWKFDHLRYRIHSLALPPWYAIDESAGIGLDKSIFCENHFLVMLNSPVIGERYEYKRISLPLQEVRTIDHLAMYT